MIEEHEWKKIEDMIEVAKNEIIQEVYLRLPAAAVEIVNQKIVMHKLKEKLFKDNSEFAKHKDIVLSVVQEIEGKNPGKSYEKILEEANPIIEHRIGLTDKLDLTTKEKPQRLTYLGEL